MQGRGGEVERRRKTRRNRSGEPTMAPGDENGGKEEAVGTEEGEEGRPEVGAWRRCRGAAAGRGGRGATMERRRRRRRPKAGAQPWRGRGDGGQRRGCDGGRGRGGGVERRRRRPEVGARPWRGRGGGGQRRERVLGDAGEEGEEKDVGETEKKMKSKKEW